MRCSVCGSTEFRSHDVLWEQLISDWQLAPDEVKYVNDQQGKSCNTCKANLRSIALADTIRSYFRTSLTLEEMNSETIFGEAEILEINEAGSLTTFLESAPRYHFGAYPALDMHAIPYATGSLDLLVHSDTLEHIENPVHALQECHRVLKPSGALAFTVPIIVGRLSRNRSGLPRSYHGNASSMPDDFMVHTEFGADAWTYAMQAGFSYLELHSVGYPAGIAMLARKRAEA